MFSRKTRPAVLTIVDRRADSALAVPALPNRSHPGKVTDEKDAVVQGAQILVTAIPDQGGQKWQPPRQDATTSSDTAEIWPVISSSPSKKASASDENRAAVKIGNFTTLNFKLSRVRG